MNNVIEEKISKGSKSKLKETSYKIIDSENEEDKKCIGSNTKSNQRKVFSNEESPFSPENKRNKPINIFSDSKNNMNIRYKILGFIILKQVSDLEKIKDGRRIFNNRTIYTGFEGGYLENFLEFKQLLYENLLFTEKLSNNSKEKFSMESAIFSTFVYDPEFILPLIKNHKFKVNYF